MHKDIISTFNLRNVFLIDHIAGNIISRMKNQQMCADSTNLSIAQEKFEKVHKDAANLSYFISCTESQCLQLPVFQRIVDQKLILVDYQMSIGVSKAMAEGFKKDPSIVKDIFF